jgi:hypothetical protein
VKVPSPIFSLTNKIDSHLKGQIGLLTSKNAESGFTRFIVMPHDYIEPKEKEFNGIDETLCFDVDVSKQVKVCSLYIQIEMAICKVIELY